MTIPEEFQDLLSKRVFGHVATIGPNGAPQSNPVWLDWDGQHLLFSLTKERQKYRNLKRDPKIAISFTDPEQPYRYLEVRGVVERIDDDPEKTLINRLAQKYMDQPEYPYTQPGDERVIVRVRPERTTSMG